MQTICTLDPLVARVSAPDFRVLRVAIVTFEDAVLQFKHWKRELVLPHGAAP